MSIGKIVRANAMTIKRWRIERGSVRKICPPKKMSNTWATATMDMM